MDDPSPILDELHLEREFMRLYSINQPRTFAYILSLVGDWNDAQEVLQETSMRAWSAFRDFTPGTNFGAWIRSIAFYQAQAYRKRAKRSPLLMSDDFLHEVASAQERLSSQLDDQLLALRHCLDHLAPRDRDLLTACYRDGAAVNDVAQRWGRPAGTLYKSLTRIRRALFECVRRRISAEDSR